MAKKKAVEQQEEVQVEQLPPVRVLAVKRNVSEGYSSEFYYVEYEFPHDIFEKHVKEVNKSNPDILSIMLNMLTLKVRDHLGL